MSIPLPSALPLGFGRLPGTVIQYAYTVPDLAAAIDLYVTRFDAGPWFRRGPFTPPQARYRGEPVSMTISLARCFAGDSMIELVQQHDATPSVFNERPHGFHHWAVGVRDMDAAIARFAGFGYPVAFSDVVPSGARIVYMDATADLPGMIELIEMNAQQESMYAAFRDAAAGWDGTRPVREGLRTRSPPSTPTPTTATDRWVWEPAPSP
jgi:Glyoxalase/Bleomycin resistance protein/Dioxygenase superfamily